MQKKMKHKTGSDITEDPYRPLMTACKLLSLNFLFLKLVQVVKCHVVWLQKNKKKDIWINN